VPPPLPAPLGSSISGRLKVAALVALGLGSAIVGGFFLPGAKPASGTEKHATAPKLPTDVPPKAQLDEGPPELTVPVSNQTPRSERTADAPVVTPQLPSTEGALGVSLLIDREIDRALGAAGVPASPLASDAEFLRRVSLDVTGRIPTREATIAFLDSQDPYKRAKVIDELLASPEYGRHFAQIWTDLLIKRDFDTNKNLKSDPFTNWLADEFNKGRGWDRIVTDMVTGEGREDQVPETFFVLANQDNNQPAPNKLVGATANLFMGVQLQCAECHVHPFHDQWSKDDFWGMAAFYGHTRAERGGMAKKPTGPATIAEVEQKPAVKGKGNGQGKAILTGAVIAIPDPNDPKKTTGTARAKFFQAERPALAAKPPYRAALAIWLTAKNNVWFAPAMVNRTWHLFFARGFVNPIEDMSDKNKPSHPVLLKTLAADFTASGYDLKFLIRAICNSQAYQRTSRPLSANANDEKLFSHMPVKILGARELLDSLTIATGHQEKDKAGGQRPRGKLNVGPATLVRFFDTREYDDDPTDFSYGVPQLLRVMNSNLSNSSAEAASRLEKSVGKNRDKVIEAIFLTALSRRPFPTETNRMAAFVDKAETSDKGYAGVFWALLNSAEFASNR
jgi:hypothetical protein